MIASIQVDRVSKRYGSGARAIDALASVSLQVSPGEIYGLLGRNGAGKTTLVKVLLDIVRPSTGATAVLGIQSRDRRARRRVGYLPEDHRFPEYQTAAGALDFYALLSGTRGVDRRQRVPELLALVGLADAARRKVRTFSKGMKQRLGLAQAMVHDPDVLFLDEPTDGVDPVGRAEIRDVLVRLKARGKTVFLNSHLLSEVERLCDRVGILDRGRLLREGSLLSLTQTERIYELVCVPPLDQATLVALRGMARSVAPRPDGVLELGLEQDADLDRVVDELRRRGIGIRGLTAQRHSLEDVFLATLAAGPTDAVPAAPPAIGGRP